MEHILVLSIVGVALILFVTEVIRPDLVAIGVMLVLFVTGIVDAEAAFSGFSNPAVITVIAMFILSAGLVNTGVADFLGRGILTVCGSSPIAVTAGTMITVAVMSAFMNNIGAVAVMIPAMFAISQKINYPVARLLMPLSFGSLLGGLLTSIGTPPNLLISSALETHGFDGFRLFDFAPTGLVILAIGVVYMVFVGRKLIPIRDAGRDLSKEFQLDEYLTELVIPVGSSYAGRSLREIDLRVELGLNVLRMRRERNGRLFSYVPGPDSLLEEGDRMIAQGSLTPLIKEKNTGKIEIYAEHKFTESDLQGDGMELAEVVISPNSDLIGRSIRNFDARRLLNVLVLALKRGGQNQIREFAAIPLEAGDVLLVQGHQNAIATMARSSDFLVVSRVKPEQRDYRKTPIALGIMALTVGLAAFGIVHISVAAMLGALLMAVTKCLPLEEFYQSVDWRVIFLIAGMIPLGIAMDDDHTGTARWLADAFLNTTGTTNPLLVLAALFLFATLITEIMSNAAAAVLLAPISIAISNSMGIEPYPFLMAVAIGASSTFMTPIGHQSNVLIYGVGNYRFTDFARAGALLNLIIFFAILVVVPYFWPFRPLVAQ